MELHNLLLFFACALNVGHVLSACDFGWIAFQNTCHHFSHDAETWADSRDFCTVLGGKLVEVETIAEANHLDDYVLMQNGTWYWIGMTDELVEGTWLWASGSPVTVNHWYPGEPNTYQGTPENCGIIGATGRWYDAPCNTNLANFICEKDPAM